MQKIIRSAIIALLVLVTVGIIFSQTRLYSQQHAAIAAATNRIEALPAIAPQAAPAMPSMPDLAITTMLAEREKDREILRNIERDVAKLAASSLAQNYVMLFQAIIYFLTLIIIFNLLETVKRFASSATKSADAAKLLAESIHKTAENAAPAHKKRPEHNKFLVRRLRGNYRKR